MSTIEDTDGVPGVPACFFFANAIDRSVTGYQVCKACESVTGPGGIDGAQRLFGLWRIYCTSIKARNNLIKSGVTINNQFIPIIGINPMVVNGAGDGPTVKVIIGKIAKSISNDEIEKSLRELEGIEIRSKLYEECYRDDQGKLSLFKSGRRFVYISVPPKPLPTQFKVGKWTPTLYHYGQKEKEHNSKVSALNNVGLRNGVNDTQSENQNTTLGESPSSQETRDDTQVDVTQSVINTPIRAAGENNRQTNINSFFAAPAAPLSQSQQSNTRPSRSQSKIKPPRTVSRSQSESLTRKRNSNEFNENPRMKSQRTDDVTNQDNSWIDYYDFTPRDVTAGSGSMSSHTGTGD